jgi:hypothetical protein
MRIAAIYDIHANVSALEGVLSEVRQAQVDRIVIGGDVLPGPLPRETIQCLLELDIPVQFIHGNGDREVLAQMSGVETDWYRTAPEQWREPVRWTAQQLHSQHQRLLAHWPPTCRVEIPGLGNVLFCHATPRNDTTLRSLPASHPKIASCLSSKDSASPRSSAAIRTCSLTGWSERLAS